MLPSSVVFTARANDCICSRYNCIDWSGEAFTILQGRTEMYTGVCSCRVSAHYMLQIKWEVEKRWRNGITCMWFHMTHGDHRWLWLAWSSICFKQERKVGHSEHDQRVLILGRQYEQKHLQVYTFKIWESLFPMMQKSNFCTLKTSLSFHHFLHFLFIFAVLKEGGKTVSV